MVKFRSYFQSEHPQNGNIFQQNVGADYAQMIDLPSVLPRKASTRIRIMSKYQTSNEIYRRTISTDQRF